MQPRDNTQVIINAYSSGGLFRNWGNNQGEGFCPVEKVLVDKYGLRPNAEILNVGCGSGRETFAFYRAGYNHVRGVDCTPAVLEEARRYAKKEGLEIEFTLAQGSHLPFSSNMFDLVTFCENVLGHITPRLARVRRLPKLIAS